MTVAIFPVGGTGGGPPTPPTPKAATFVVDPVFGVGDFTTIEAAVAATPPEGADIYVREGTYAPVTTIALPLDRPVKIRGAGAVGITKITVPSTGGGSPSPLFSVAAGSTAEYSFSGFKATGDNTFQQSILSTASAVDFYFEDVEITGLWYIISTTTTPTVVFTNVEITMTTFATVWSYWRGVAGGKFIWNYVNVTSVNIQSSDAILGRPEWAVVDSYIGGGPLTSEFRVGKVDILGLKADKAHFFLNTPGCRIVNLELIDGNITIEAGNTRTAIANSIFTTPTLSGSQLSIVGVGATQTAVSGCVFNGAGFTGTNANIDVSNSQGVTIVGCSFAGNGTGAGTDANIHVGATGGTTEVTVVGCRFSGGTPAQAVKEFLGLGTITGRYDDNLGFQTSALGSVLSTVDGDRQFNATGVATVDALTTVFTHATVSPFGLLGNGSIKNTGANGMTIRRTATDEYGTTDFQEDPILAGASAIWTLDVALGTALPPYRSFTLSIKSTTPGSPTTYSVRASSTGAY